MNLGVIVFGSDEQDSFRYKDSAPTIEEEKKK